MKFLLLIASCSLLFSFSACKKGCKGEPNDDCVCVEIYDPVCGCNGRTYGNSCEAECAGITDYSDGKCGL